jgi:phosphoribosyl 1,2-cyclic phosphodiesterase
MYVCVYLASALEWLPHYSINKIDAVFLTHGHADAILGLDDLRSFSIMQRTDIPIYVTETTRKVVSTTFPYLIDRSKATGNYNLGCLIARLLM